MYLLTGASVNRVGNHLTLLVWYALDRFPYSKYITSYYMKLIYKISCSDP